jgi:putative oxidoreductase
MFKDSNYPALIGRLLIAVSFLVSGFGKVASPAITQGFIAAVAFHANFADQNQMIHCLNNLIITDGLLQVAAFGAGKFSVDAPMERVRGSALGVGSSRVTA